jgi:uncharacterized protein (DUF1330 family)
MTKPAYMIFGVDINDMEKFGEYAEGAAPLLGKFGASVLSATNSIEKLHGNWVRARVTVLKFPSLDQARALWESSEYAPLKQLRESCSQSDIILIEGMSEEDSTTTPADDGSSHYVLGCNDTKNTDWVPEYQAKVPAIAARYNLVVPCVGESFEILDGRWPRQSVILLQFSSNEDYQGFWNDPDYKPIKKLREDNTEGDHIAFPGGFDPL